MSFAFVFPGQGSQSVGMLSALAAQHQAVRSGYAEASQALGFDLWDIVEGGIAYRERHEQITPLSVERRSPDRRAGTQCRPS